MSKTPAWSIHANHIIHPKMVVRRIFTILLYFVGVFIADFGILGTAASIPGFDSKEVYITLAAGIVVFIGSLIVFFRIRFKIPCLPWLQYLWWMIGATIGVIIAIAIEFAVVPDLNGKGQSISNAVFSCMIFFYGITLTVIAHLQPSLQYQISENTRKILKATPGEQMLLSDLVICLQQQYKCSEDALNRYVEKVKGIEHMTIPGTPTKLYRIRGTQEVIAFPQVYSIITYDLRQEVFGDLRFLNEENVDIGLFRLGRRFEDTLKTYLIAANTKGKISLAPGSKKPEKMQLVDMISYIKNNGIITDDADLSFLRQGRNERVHGTMPSLAERQILIRNVRYVAGLYIDYIRLLDSLTHSLDINTF